MDKNEAKARIQSIVGNDFVIEDVQDRGRTYTMYCRNKDSEVVPSGIIYAIDKVTGKTGSSITSIEDAIDAAQ